MATHVDTPRRSNLKDDSVVFLRQKRLSDIRKVQVESGNPDFETDCPVFTNHHQSYLISEEKLHAMPSRQSVTETEGSLFTQILLSQTSCNAKLSDRPCPINEPNKTQFSTVKTTAEITQIFRVSPPERDIRSNNVAIPGRVVERTRNTFGASRAASKKKARLVGWATSGSPCRSECEPLRTESQLAWAGTKGMTLFLLVICTVSLSGNISLMAMVPTDSSMTSDLKMYVMVETATDVAILISTMCVIAWLMWESFRRIGPQEKQEDAHKSSSTI